MEEYVEEKKYWLINILKKQKISEWRLVAD